MERRQKHGPFFLPLGSSAQTCGPEHLWMGKPWKPWPGSRPMPLAWEASVAVGSASCEHRLQEEAWPNNDGERGWAAWMIVQRHLLGFQRTIFLNGRGTPEAALGWSGSWWWGFSLGVLEGMGSEAEACHSSKLWSFWRKDLFSFSPDLSPEFAYGWRATESQFLFSNSFTTLLNIFG